MTLPATSADRIPFVIGNWKMNGLGGSLAEVSAIAAAAAQGEAGRARCALCPPATLITRAAAAAEGRIVIGGQDCAVEASGAHTGDIAADMLRDAGAEIVIVGHSERRADHGESNTLVRAKADAAIKAGLTAVICIGENRAARDSGKLYEIVGAQLEGSVRPSMAPESVILAYEPVWAIGTGRTPTEADVARMHGFIRRRIADMMGEEAAARMRILYGGSVKPANAKALMSVDDVDGALVGGASLTATDFLGIAAAYR